MHTELLRHVPPERIHLNKKTVSATADSEKATLFFADGTSVQGDVLIGADGINSVGSCSLDLQINVTPNLVITEGSSVFCTRASCCTDRKVILPVNI